MHYELITEPKRLREVFAELQKLPKVFVGWDTETYGPLTEWQRTKRDRYVWELTAKLAGFSFAFADRAFYIPIAHKGPNYPEDSFRKFLCAFFSIPNRTFGHNLDYDYRVIRNYMHGHMGGAFSLFSGNQTYVKDGYLVPNKSGDTMILAWLTGSGRMKYTNTGFKEFYGLKDLAAHHFGHKMASYTDTVGAVQIYESGPTEDDIAAAREKCLAETREARPTIRGLDVPPSPRELQKMNKVEKLLRKQIRYKEPQMNDLTGEHVLAYACEDAYWTAQLAIRLWGKVTEMGFEENWDKYQMPLLMTLRRMHDVGLPVSTEVAKSIEDECRAIYQPLYNEFLRETGISITQNQKLGEYLFKKLKVIPSKDLVYTKSGQLKVDYDTLDKARNNPACTEQGKRLIDMKLRHAEVHKIASTYTQSFIRQLPYSPDGVIHPRFKMTGTRTGRLASADPNAQNLPRKTDGIPDVRKIVKAPPGFVVGSMDLSQIEIVVLAHYSQDARLREVILDGKSMHDITAAALGIPRHQAKAVNFLKNYRGGAKKLSLSLGIPLVEKETKDGSITWAAPDFVQEYSRKYDETYEGVVSYWNSISDYAVKNGYVKTLLGRRRYLPNLSRNRKCLKELDEIVMQGYRQRDREMKSGAWTSDKEARFIEAKEKRSKLFMDVAGDERIASNTPIQGGAADIMNVAMVNLDDYIMSSGSRMRIIAQVHDEIVLIIPEETAKEELDKVKHFMENSIKLSLPIKAEGSYGPSWSEAK